MVKRAEVTFPLMVIGRVVGTEEGGVAFIQNRIGWKNCVACRTDVVRNIEVEAGKLM